MQADDILDLDAIGQARAVLQGDISSAELTRAAIARIDARNPVLNAVIRTRFDRAITEARQVARDGPLAGVPILVKDFDGRIAGEPLTAGMRGAKASGWRETQSAIQITDLQTAGAIILGWTNTPELGMMPTTEPLAFGPTRNPWHRDRSSGGSSGGSAAAVAAGMVAVAQGGDGAESLRIPASACGVFTLKPSRGAVSLGPHEVEKTAGYVTKLGLSRTVRDMRLLFRICRGPRLGDAYGPGREVPDRRRVRPLRIGVMTLAPSAICEVDPVCAQAANEAGQHLALLGHRVEQAHPAALEDPGILRHRHVIRSVWVRQMLKQWGQRLGRELGPADVEPLTWATAEEGRGISAEDYVTALDALHLSSWDILQWWHGFDLLLTPTLACPPPPIGFLDAPPDDLFAGRARSAPLVAFTMPFNVTGQPAVSVPFGTDSKGLPVGVQLVAAPGDEDLLLDVAQDMEATRPWQQIAPLA